MTNPANSDLSQASSPSKNKSGESLRLMKWLVLIALVVLLLLALFLPDRSLAVPDVGLQGAGEHGGQIAALQRQMP